MQWCLYIRRLSGWTPCEHFIFWVEEVSFQTGSCKKHPSQEFGWIGKAWIGFQLLNMKFLTCINCMWNTSIFSLHCALGLINSGILIYRMETNNDCWGHQSAWYLNNTYTTNTLSPEIGLQNLSRNQLLLLERMVLHIWKVRECSSA